MSVYLFHGDKGGVGKSLLATTFVEYLLARNQPVTIVDTDLRNGDVARIFQESGIPTIVTNLREREGWIELANTLDTAEANDIIVSLPANIGAELTDEATFLHEALSGLQRSLTIFWVMNRSADSVALLRPVIDAFGATATLVAVKNLYFGDPDRFARWSESKTRHAFLKGGGKEMDFEELLDSVVDATFLAYPPKRWIDAALSYGRTLTLRLSRFPGHLDRAGEYPANEVSWKRRIGRIAKNSRKTRFAA